MNIVKAGTVVLIAAIVIGGLSLLAFVTSGAEYATPTLREEVVHTSTPQPVQKRTEYPTETPTPGIDFAATINALAVEQRNQEATATQAAMMAQNEMTQVALAHERDMNEVEYTGAVAEAEHNQEMWLYNQEIMVNAVSNRATHEAGISQTELEALAERLDDKRIIDGIYQSAWRFAILVIGGLMCVLLAVSVMRQYRKGETVEENAATIQVKIDELEEERQRVAIESQQQKDFSTIEDFILACEKQAGERSTKIPTNRELDDYGGQRWQDAVDILKDYGYVYATNQGTFLSRGDLGELLNELHDNGWLSPTTRAGRAKVEYTLGIRAFQNSK